MHTLEFEEAWNELSATQKKSVDADAPLLVLAGPGTGKTRVLTCRIARILDSTKDSKFRILGLTFTNAAADEIRERIIKFVPGQEDRLFLGTFHSFCADILRQHGIHLNINPNFNIYSHSRDLEAIMNEAINKAKDINRNVNDSDKKKLPIIQRLKSNLILPEECLDIFSDKNFAEKMAIIYKTYEQELDRRNALDFNSLILKTHELFIKYPAFAKRYRIVYPYICIDEFQDTNLAQYRLIRSITGDTHKNLFVVADDDQIIYQWNGASYKRIIEFTNDYSPEIIQLPVNYRCPPEIVNLANNLIRNNFLRTENKQPLQASRRSQGKNVVRVLPAFRNFDEEAANIAKDIKKLHINNLESAVVLGRSRKLLETVKLALQNEGVPAVISQRKDEFESPPFIWLHSILRLANDRQNHVCLEAVCGAFAQLTEVVIDTEDVVTEARTSNCDYLQRWIKLARDQTINPSVIRIIDKTSSFLGEGRNFYLFSKDMLEWFDEIAQNSENINDIGNEAFICYNEERSAWNELTRDIIGTLGNNITLEAFLQELQMRSKEASLRPGTVVLTTIHGAKSKEFDHVYLIGLVDDELPSFQSIQKGSKSPEMEEERRNCFVAVTRTIKTLTISYANKYYGWQKRPSRFLFEMGLISE